MNRTSILKDHRHALRAVVLLMYSLPLFAQHNPVLFAKLEWFQDARFGLLMHWGPYSQWSVVESWSICPEDEGWTQRKGPYADDYYGYRRAYEDLKTTFDPTLFDPDKWATAAYEAGMRYVVFTTKHHDGFCMFDTKQTDYRITDAGCPFSVHPRSNVTREIFNAFRERGFGVGAYFSKPDWHSNDYWWRYFPPFDRNVNYDIGKYPERWEAFKTFTYSQIEELMRDYGPIDILWLDGGWVQPVTGTSPRWGKNPMDQDIDMPRIATMARAHQPGLIIVDRAVEGDYQDYRTPEQHVPDQPPPYLWETCMTMATSWSYVEGDVYKPTRQLVHILVDIVAKGGNFLLNIGPSPQGEFAPDAYDRLHGIGDWMRVNGSAIHGTRAVPPYKEGNVCYTRNRDGSINAIVLAMEGENAPPSVVELRSFTPVSGTSVRMLGIDRELSWDQIGETTTITIPDDVRAHPPSSHAWTVVFHPAESR